MTDTTELFEEDFEKVKKFSKETRAKIKTMSNKEARYLVKSYYDAQEDRKRRNNQMRALQEDNLDSAVLGWFAEQADHLEKMVGNALDVYSSQNVIGAWVRTIKGIGPVIAAGLIAHLDITRAPTAGHFLSFAGLVASIKWEKGKLRPWNAELKRLCWIIGESFVKVSGGENPSPYGMFYTKWKKIYTDHNEAGKLRETAEQSLRNKNYSKDTLAYAAYIEGKLPKAHIHALAKRKPVQLFICHLFDFWYKEVYKIDPPEIYTISILKHAHKIPRHDEIDQKEWARYFS